MISSLFLLIGFIVVFMVVEVVNSLLNHSLNSYGIVPRTTSGLIGIPLSPLLHGSFLHAQSNAVGLLGLGGLAAITGGGRFPQVFLVIVLLGGLGVWLVGRPATHIGASGLVFGFFGFLMLKGLVDRSILSIVVAIVVAGVFGYMILTGILPTRDYVSWEGHLCGLLAGALAAVMLRRRRDSRRQRTSPEQKM